MMMQNRRLDLLVTFDENYIGPFRTMLTSVIMNNPGRKNTCLASAQRYSAEQTGRAGDLLCLSRSNLNACTNRTQDL